MLANFDAAEADTDEVREEKKQPERKPVEKDGKQTPVKAEAKEVTESVKPEPARENVEADPELDAIKEPKGAHPKTLEGFRALKAVAAEKGKQLKEAQAKVAELEVKAREAVKAAPLSDEERKELKRLQDFEFMQSPEKSARITREFDAKMNAANDVVLPLLASLGMPETDAQAKEIAVAESKRQGKEIQPGISLEAMKKAGGIKAMPFNWWDKGILNNDQIDGRTRAKLSRFVNEYFDTDEARSAALEAAPKDRETFAQQQQTAQLEEGKQYHAKAAARAGVLQKELGSWAQEQQVPANASPEQKAAIEASNKRLKEVLYPAFVKGMQIKSPEEHADLAMGKGTPLATYYQSEAERLTKEMEVVRKEADDAKAELSRIKSAGRIKGQTNVSVPVNRAKLPSLEENIAATNW